MSDDEREAPRSRGGGSRRGFLAKLGAVGLVTSGAVFARSTPAMAANYQCCNLVFVPPNVTFSNCSAATNYTWSCTTSGGFLWCQCCEKKSGGTTVGSAASCQYG
ncbi:MULTISPECIES: hypothetical protein [Micromonospora]|uniref:hypothetical protein n=1 Tax=Micromonospora TaxID=1873 RepID=UPI001376B200|nr:hypothetical protein [Micromonospora rubida]NBE80751.1 hypothetical protein [Micromonospora rubida]